ncbi:MAG: DUF4347 domain-containing protein, partial [Desulfobacterales bacterium]|nr:DUF4347 domain-containing protein [Desulfobacterales bacterium]
MKKPFDRRSSPFVYEALEKRILLSGDPLAEGSHLIPDLAEDAPQSMVYSPSEPQGSAMETVHPGKELILINGDVSEFDTLVQGLMSRDGALAEVVILDGDQDGLAQVTDILSTQSDLSAIHIISHGRAGAVELGNTELTQAVIQQNPWAFSAWANALSETGDILFYGCNLAENESGKEFIQAVAQATGADIAASQDLTGHGTLGGDWDLEYHAGRIDTRPLATDTAVSDWQGTLDTTTGLVGHWTFDTDGSDSSGNGYDGTLQEGTTINTAPATNKLGDGKLQLTPDDDDDPSTTDLSPHAAGFSN